jgi:hypothetical protein
VLATRDFDFMQKTKRARELLLLEQSPEPWGCGRF